MFRRVVTSKLVSICKRTYNTQNSAEDVLRANSVIQHTKDDIIREIRIVLKNEFETRLNREIEDLRLAMECMFLFQFGVVNLIIFTALSDRHESTVNLPLHFH